MIRYKERLNGKVTSEHDGDWGPWDLGDYSFANMGTGIFDCKFMPPIDSKFKRIIDRSGTGI